MGRCLRKKVLGIPSLTACALLQALSGLTKLTTVSISMVNGKYIGAWPDWSRLSKLESMTLRGSRGYMFPWAALPGWFGDLPKLHSLDIRSDPCLSPALQYAH